MKKYLYIAIAAATFASCSQDEVMEVAEKQAIQFGNTFVGNSTRAVDPSYSSNTIQSFQLFGTVNNVSIYNNVTVENKTAENSATEAGYKKVWYCPVTQYWVEGAAYKFIAIIDGDKKDGDKVITSTAVTNGMPTTITYNADGVTDLLCNTQTRTGAATNGVVGFTFTHLLSKVYFTFKNEMPSETKYTYKVSNVKIISGLYKSGTYTIEPAQGVAPWSLGTGLTEANVTDDDLSFGNIVADDKSTEAVNLQYNVGKTSQDARLILPGNQTLKVQYTVEILYDNNSVKTETKTAEITNANGTAYKFEANHVYNITGTLKLDLQKPIQFTVTEAPTWDATPTEIPVTVQ